MALNVLIVYADLSFNFHYHSVLNLLFNVTYRLSILPNFPVPVIIRGMMFYPLTQDLIKIKWLSSIDEYDLSINANQLVMLFEASLTFCHWQSHIVPYNFTTIDYWCLTGSIWLQHCHLHAFNSTQDWATQRSRERGYKIVIKWADKENPPWSHL
jgi:hypothetical protein